ncbi:DUF2479 domain-containing protein [Clostridium perfringens]|nr:DUF2479 domain-containing protein [Clostridium perfringens]
MSEIGLNINVDSYNNEGIKTIKGNNNAEIYKLYILKNKRRLNLVGKTVKLGYVMVGTTKGDIIEDLNITNAEQGEITLPITNRISKKDGVYSCQLAIYREDEFLEYTATFGLTVEANIFTKIAGEIENSKDLTYIERILEEATNISEELKSNIPVARQLNSDLENQNRILNENMDRANGVNNTLITTTEQSKVAATDAIEKKSQLESSITKAKEFIDGLDGSQDIPGMRMELTELQNGLKSNQSLEYSGSSITANDTLEGRTEGMRIGGRTLQNVMPELNKSNFNFTGETNLVDGFFVIPFGVDVNASLIGVNRKKSILKPNTKYTIIADILENDTGQKLGMSSYGCSFVPSKNSFENSIGISMITGTTKNNFNDVEIKTDFLFCIWGNGGDLSKKIKFKAMVLEGDWTDKPIPNFFEGLKSFGEAEQEGDKYKISILSHCKNFFKSYKSKSKGNTSIFNIENDNVTIGTNQSPSWTNASINYGKLKIGSKYTVSCESFTGGVGDKVLFAVKKYRGRDEVGAYGDITKSSLSLTFTVVDDADIVLRFFVNNATPINTPTSITYNNIQIIEGVKTDYAPSIIDKKDILLKEPLKEDDYLYEDNGQVKVYRDARKYVITGNEDWSHYTDNRDFACMGFFLQLNKKFDAKLGGKFICNNFKGSDTDVFPGNITVDDEIIFVKGRSGEESPSYIKISILKSKLITQNVEGFKKWLKANPTEIIYQLATPAIEIVENCVDIDLDTFQDKTYFNILNSLPGTLDFKVPSNLGSVVQNMAKEVNNIWDVINNLLVPGLIDVNKTVAMATIKNNLQ